MKKLISLLLGISILGCLEAHTRCNKVVIAHHEDANHDIIIQLQNNQLSHQRIKKITQGAELKNEWVWTLVPINTKSTKGEGKQFGIYKKKPHSDQIIALIHQDEEIKTRLSKIDDLNQFNKEAQWQLASIDGTYFILEPFSQSKEIKKEPNKKLGYSFKNDQPKITAYYTDNLKNLRKDFSILLFSEKSGNICSLHSGNSEDRYHSSGFKPTGLIGTVIHLTNLFSL